MTCKQLCVTHFKNMTMESVPRVIMTKFAKFCHACEKWFKRRIVEGIICPCCHKKFRDIPRHITEKTKRYLYFKEYHARNKARRNETSKKWYQRNKEKHKENMLNQYQLMQ